MFTLATIRARVHRIAMRLPLLDDEVETRHVVTCEIETDGGITGFGMTGQILPFGVHAALLEDIFPLVRGMDVRDTEAIHHRVWKVVNQRAQTGAVTGALSALDIALWDAHGKGVDRTVAQLLGGFRDKAPTYVTFGIPEYDRETLVEAARLQVKDGVDALKMVVAVHEGGWREDARRVRAVREVIGDDVDLALDANYMFDPLDARMLCRAIEDCDIAWFEEPLLTNDPRQLAALRSRTSIPISAGQNDGHRWRLRDFLLEGAVDIIQPNVCYSSGFTEVRKVAHMAQAMNVPCGNGGNMPLFNMHMVASMMNGHKVEFHLANKGLGEDVFIDPPEPVDNQVVIPTAPGLGLRVNEDFLARTTVKN